VGCKEKMLGPLTQVSVEDVTKKREWQFSLLCLTGACEGCWQHCFNLIYGYEDQVANAASSSGESTSRSPQAPDLCQTIKAIALCQLGGGTDGGVSTGSSL
jgi:hypothetical protein